ncbi:MAG: hypothetical protein PVH17_05980 [Anaerolineae bacterium]|jgi:hypothetical protein
MGETSYTLESDEKATQVMIGTPDMLVWGHLVTKEQIQIVAFLNTLAEDFVPLHDASILFLAPTRRVAPIEKPRIFVKLEEILLFYSMSEEPPLPEESEVRQYEPVEALVGSFRIEGDILKSPIATLQNLLLVTKDSYLPLYQATIRHVANSWLGAFSSTMVHVRRARLTMTTG